MKAVALIATLLLSACGQKGPLYLPEPAGNVIVRPTQTPPPPATEDADKAKERTPGEPPP